MAADPQNKTAKKKFYSILDMADNTQLAVLAKSLEVNLPTEMQAIDALLRELGMNTSYNICNLNHGSYLTLIDNFTNLACANEPPANKRNAQSELKNKIIDYFRHFSNEEGSASPDFSYHYSNCMNGIDGKRSRNNAYVHYAAFAKEMEAFCNYAETAYACGTDRVSQSKASKAHDFLDKVSNVMAAMKSNGGLTAETLSRAEKAEATFFPAIIATLATPQQAFASLPAVVQEAPKFAPKEEKRRETQLRPKIDTKLMAKELRTIRDKHEKIMKDWLRLSKTYNEEALRINNASPQIITTGISMMSNILDALADPIRPLNSTALETFSKKLEELLPGILALEERRHATPALLADDDKKIGLMLEHFANIMDFTGALSEAVQKVQSGLKI